MEQVTIGCQIQSYQQMKDRGFKIVLETGELPEEAVVGIHKLYNRNAWATIGENPVSYGDIQEQLPTALQQIKKGKSPSQRLRETIYVLRKTLGVETPFDSYYEQIIEKLIQGYQVKIDEFTS